MKKSAIAETVENMGGAAEEIAAPGEMNSEQAQEAAALAAMVAEAGEPVLITGEPAPEPEIPRMSAEESLAGLLSAASGVAAFMGLENVAAIWNPQTCEKCAGLSVPVLKKYPWGARVIDFLETGAGVEEMALGMFLLPVGMATAQAWKADAAALAAKREKRTEAGQDAPDSGGPDANQ